MFIDIVDMMSTVSYNPVMFLAESALSRQNGGGGCLYSCPPSLSTPPTGINSPLVYLIGFLDTTFYMLFIVSLHDYIVYDRARDTFIIYNSD